MPNHLKKGQRGAAVKYISRDDAVAKLQLTFKEFRRLCILKGIYPRQPRKLKKVNKGDTSIRTFYFLKDIQFLAHEPLIEKFRRFNTFKKKVRRAIASKDQEYLDYLEEHRPYYAIDHIIKERYPSFVDALREMDDVLCLCCLFTSLPKAMAPTELVLLCQRLVTEFLLYVIESRSLRKVFISVRGFYFQAEVEGQPITWIVRHQFGFNDESRIDFGVMVTFAELYTALLGFVNFKLYQSLNLCYPPELSMSSRLALGGEGSEAQSSGNADEWLSSLAHPLNRVTVAGVDSEVLLDEFPAQADDPVQLEQFRRERARSDKLKQLFSGTRFYLNREVPRDVFVFVIRCFGGEVSWDKTIHAGATFDEHDATITHHVLDRQAVEHGFPTRYYVQPQWVFDCVNHCAVLPVEDYFPGATLPAHLSPFVDDTDGAYVPPDRQMFLQKVRGVVYGENDVEPAVSPVKKKQQQKKKKEQSLEESDDKPFQATVEHGSVVKENRLTLATKKKVEAKRLAEMMIPKRKKWLFKKLVQNQRKKKRAIGIMAAKRKAIDELKVKSKESEEANEK